MGLPVETTPPPPQQRVAIPHSATVTPRDEPDVQSVALQHAECPICFEPLCRGEIGVFLDASGQRVSKHFYNLAAARELLANGNSTCPLTRKPIASVRQVPDIRSDPDGWFGTVDVDGDGQLSLAEVVEALKAMLPVDPYAFDRAAAQPGWWQQYDRDGSGFIERHELPKLVEYVQKQVAARRTSETLIPNIRADRNAWFGYWDEDDSGTLDKEEVVRALLKTLQLTSDPARVAQMRSTVDAIWCLFDEDGNGTVDREEVTHTTQQHAPDLDCLVPLPCLFSRLLTSCGGRVSPRGSFFGLAKGSRTPLSPRWVIRAHDELRDTLNLSARVITTVIRLLSALSAPRSPPHRGRLWPNDP